jgi:hypothetical protein
MFILLLFASIEKNMVTTNSEIKMPKPAPAVTVNDPWTRCIVPSAAFLLHIQTPFKVNLIFVEVN